MVNYILYPMFFLFEISKNLKIHVVGDLSFFLSHAASYFFSIYVQNEGTLRVSSATTLMTRFILLKITSVPVPEEALGGNFIESALELKSP